MSELFSGKYAEYIVPSFAAAILVFGWLILDSVLRTRMWKKRAEELQAQRDGKTTP